MPPPPFWMLRLPLVVMPAPTIQLRTFTSLRDNAAASADAPMPATDSFELGCVVPIPTCPLAASTLSRRSGKKPPSVGVVEASCVVPRRLVARRSGSDCQAGHRVGRCGSFNGREACSRAPARSAHLSMSSRLLGLSRGRVGGRRLNSLAIGRGSGIDETAGGSISASAHASTIAVRVAPGASVPATSRSGRPL